MKQGVWVYSNSWKGLDEKEAMVYSHNMKTSKNKNNLLVVHPSAQNRIGQSIKSGETTAEAVAEQFRKDDYKPAVVSSSAYPSADSSSNTNLSSWQLEDSSPQVLHAGSTDEESSYPLLQPKDEIETLSLEDRKFYYATCNVNSNEGNSTVLIDVNKHKKLVKLFGIYGGIRVYDIEPFLESSPSSASEPTKEPPTCTTSGNQR